jgi:glucokinase
VGTAESISVNEQAKFVVGIDLGGTKVICALARLDGEILRESMAGTDPRGGSALVDQVVEMVEQLCHRSDVTLDQIAATAIGVPGAPDDDGRLLLAPNLGHADGYNFAASLEQRLGHPVVLDNDVNAAAMGELRHGRAQSSNSFCFVAVGTGIGMGIVVDGSLLRGSRGAAGEIGFLPFGADPLDIANHFRGPLEEVTSGAHISANYLRRMGIKLTSPEVFAAASAGDAHAAAVIDHEGRNIARAIVAAAAVLDPDMFVLGGGIGSRQELLPLVRQWISRFGHEGLEVHISQLGERAAVIGAVELAIDSALTSRKEQPA